MINKGNEMSFKKLFRYEKVIGMKVLNLRLQHCLIHMSRIEKIKN